MRAFLVFLSVALFSSVSFAAAPDYTTLTEAVDFDSVITGVMAVAAVLAGVYAAMRGVSLLLSVIKR